MLSAFVGATVAETAAASGEEESLSVGQVPPIRFGWRDGGRVAMASCVAPRDEPCSDPELERQPLQLHFLDFFSTMGADDVESANEETEELRGL